MAIYSFAIGAGYNVALADLVNIETIKPTGLPKLYPPQSYGTYDQGQEKVRLNGIQFYAGYAALIWEWTGASGNGYMLYGQARHLRSTFFSGAFSGPVTIYTKTTNETAYERYNAVATMSKFPESGANFKVFTKFIMRMTRLEVLT